MTQPPEYPQDPNNPEPQPTERFTEPTAQYPAHDPAPQAPHYQTTQQPQHYADEPYADEHYADGHYRDDYAHDDQHFDEDPSRIIRRWQIIAGLGIGAAALIGASFLIFGLNSSDKPAAPATSTVTTTLAGEASTVTTTVSEEHDTVETTTVTESGSGQTTTVTETDTTTVTCEPRADGDCLVQ